jgi:deoxyribonuclease IV
LIRFGPAGIPLSCKGRTLKDGIEDVHNLGLNAMEVQMVRVNVVERSPDDEEVGLTPLEIASDVVVEIVRHKGKKDMLIADLNEKIKADDILITLASGLVQNFKELVALGHMGAELDVQLSMHTPYYMDLTSDNELTQKSINSIRWAGMLTNQMKGNMVISHLGMYGNMSKKEAVETITGNVSEIMNWWEKNEIKPVLGFETSGRQEVFGSVDELLELCDNVEGIVPVINFAHVHARQNGTLREPQDFMELFDKVRSQVKGQFYTHFSGVEHEAGNEKRVTPIKKGDLRFEPLAEFLVEENPDCAIISSSPLLEHDAMYMKVIYERILTKKVSKETKVKKTEKAEKGEKQEKPAKHVKDVKSRAPRVETEEEEDLEDDYE